MDGRKEHGNWCVVAEGIVELAHLQTRRTWYQVASCWYASCCSWKERNPSCRLIVKLICLILMLLSSALHASHTSKPGACKVAVHRLNLLRVVLCVLSNRRGVTFLPKI